MSRRYRVLALTERMHRELMKLLEHGGRMYLPDIEVRKLTNIAKAAKICTWEETAQVWVPGSEDEDRIEYRCHACGALGVKLWREYQTIVSVNVLLCTRCCEHDQNAKRKDYWIGNRCPAVLTKERDTFWGFTSVPEDRLRWWEELPDVVPANRVVRTVTVTMEERLSSSKHDPDRIIRAFCGESDDDAKT